jgi:hypothetical protein
MLTKCNIVLMFKTAGQNGKGKERRFNSKYKNVGLGVTIMVIVRGRGLARCGFEKPSETKLE